MPTTSRFYVCGKLIHKIYLDTNVFDVLTKNDFRLGNTKMLFLAVESDKFEAYYSPTVIEELLSKQQKHGIKKILDEKILEKQCANLIPITQNSLRQIHKLTRAYQYVSERITDTPKGKKLIWEQSVFSKFGSQAEDRTHIATAVISGMDAFVTWNTREFIQNDRIKNWVNEVNKRLGYSEIEMFSPVQLIENSKK